MISCTENHSRPTHSAKGSDKWIQKIWNLILILIGISITGEQNEVLSLKFCNVGVNPGGGMLAFTTMKATVCSG